MPHITIREIAALNDSPNATVSFDRRGEFPVTIHDPFSDDEERRLEWFFEEYLKFPFTKQIMAQEARTSIKTYGESLFEQVFANRNAFGRYSQARQQGINDISFEIIGSSEFHRLHWEALKDPNLPTPFVLENPMVRSTFQPPIIDAQNQSSPTINLLIVTSRPSGKMDVGYRTISQPLVDGLRNANIPIQIDIVRPGTYDALIDHLTNVRDRHGVGYYHIIHFDLHGSVLTYEQIEQFDDVSSYSYDIQLTNRYGGRSDITAYEGAKAYLFFEGTSNKIFDIAEADELANLLVNHHIPIAILNACQSGKQVGDTETILGSRLLQAGVQTVIAMSYSVTVSAAKLMMQTLYKKLFAGDDLSVAIRHARSALFNQKSRRGYYDQPVDLEDWLLPVVYQSGGLMASSSIELRKFTPSEEATYYESKAHPDLSSELPYGFVGRDIDILQIEKRVLRQDEGKRRNILLIQGMGGAGKTTFLYHLADWWKKTHFVDKVFYFGYDEEAWTSQQIQFNLAKELFDDAEFKGWQALSEKAKQVKLTDHLRSQHHLLILDNLESITGANLAISHTLTSDEQTELSNFLADLLDGKTLVLLGSRSIERWLLSGKVAPLRQTDIYELPGLDPEAASTLAERILKRSVSDSDKQTEYLKSDEFRRLLKILDGYPLPLEVVLSNLVHQSPVEILEALQLGDDRLDLKSEDKTKSVLRCIDYSYSNLNPEFQNLLLCLAPFTKMINKVVLTPYIQNLAQQTDLSNLPFEYWPQLEEEISNWGLLSPHELPNSDYSYLQPTLPYFLRNRLYSPNFAVQREAIETAFYQTYDGFGKFLEQMMMSPNPAHQQKGLELVEQEYENLSYALELALKNQKSVGYFVFPLINYLGANQDNVRVTRLGQMVLNGLETYSLEQLDGEPGADFVGILDNIANHQLAMKDYESARKSYEKALEIHNSFTFLEEDQKVVLGAGLIRNLGVVAEEQRQWEKAEEYYQQALKVFIQYDDEPEQGSVFLNLGTLAWEQHQWDEADTNLQKALTIFEKYNMYPESADTYHQLGLLAFEKKQLEKAEEYSSQALKMNILLGNDYDQANNYHHLGTIFLEQRQWSQAEEHYQNALRIFIKYRDVNRQAQTYHQLGRLAEEQEQWKQAEQYYQNALNTSIELDDRYNQGIAYNQLGMIAGKQKLWTEAEGFYKKALKIFIDFQDTYYIELVTNNLRHLLHLNNKEFLEPLLNLTPEEFIAYINKKE